MSSPSFRVTLVLVITTLTFITQVQSLLKESRSPPPLYLHRSIRSPGDNGGDDNGGTTVIPPPPGDDGGDDNGGTTVIPPPPGDDGGTTVIPPPPGDDGGDDISLPPGDDDEGPTFNKPGYEVDFAKYPFMASVVQKHKHGYKFISNGVILNERWLIAAANELHDASLSTLRVIFGESKFHGDQVSDPYPVKRIVAVEGSAVLLQVSKPIDLDENAQAVSFEQLPPAEINARVLMFFTTFKNDSPLLAKKIVAEPDERSGGSVQSYAKDCYKLEPSDLGAPIFFWHDDEKPHRFVGVVLGTKLGDRHYLASRAIQTALADISE